MSVTPLRSRRVLAVFVSAAAAVGAAAAAGPADAAPAPTPAVSVDPSSRASVLAAYQNVWFPATQVPSGWTGSTTSCTPGTDSAASQQAVLKAVNFARQLAGRTPVTIAPGLTAKALTGALIMDANSTLNHDPQPGLACWTQAGHDAAASSNLFLDPFNTVNAASGVQSYLDDPGDSNSFVGHRRWLLFSRLTRFGSGTTARANALYVIDPASWRNKPAGSTVAAWPAKGWFPSQLEPDGKWSVSIPGADFSHATVTVKKGTNALPTTVLDRTAVGYGDNTIAWQVAPKYDISQGNKVYTVTIGNYVLDGVTKTTTYTTTLFDATVGMAGRNVIAFPWPTAKKVGKTFDPGATNNNGLTVYYASNTPDVCRTNFNPSTVTTLKAGTCSVFAYVGHDARWPDAAYQTRTFDVTP